MKSKFLDIILMATLITVVVSGLGFTWQQTTSPIVDGYSVDMSADGRIICATGSATRLNISTNSGQTWAEITNTNLLSPFNSDGVAISADGAKIFAIMSSNGVSGNWVFVSSDQGATWTKTGFPSGGNTAVACSADGTKVIAASAGQPIFYSTNGGINCFTSSAPSFTWKELASSADGRRMVAVALSSRVYLSDDFGANWTTIFPVQSWNAICVSGDGNWVGATSAGGSYISSDFGVSGQSIPLAGKAIACSANGSNWVIAGTGVQTYTSTNAGLNWQTNVLFLWNDVAMSADGNEIFFSSSYAGIWVGHDISSPQLNIAPLDSAVKISWLLPSTNFVLQQNTVLTTTNWIPVPNNPLLNFTNLNQEVSVPTTSSNTFFRLMAQ